MSAAILILIIATNHGVSTTSIEFNNMLSCTEAQADIIKMKEELPHNKISTRCVVNSGNAPAATAINGIYP